jgi:hypothetical protein
VPQLGQRQQPLLVVALHDPEVDETTGHVAHDTDLEPQGHDHEGHPVGGHDARDSADRVRHGRPASSAGKASLRKRPVEQEGRDDEEDRHADVELREIWRRRALARPEYEPRVVGDDAQRGDRAEGVEQGKARGATVQAAGLGQEAGIRARLSE